MGFSLKQRKNPIEDLKFDPEQWFCYPAKVGDLLCYVYFNVAYMAQGVTLCNLFQLANEEEYRNRKPDMIYVLWIVSWLGIGLFLIGFLTLFFRILFYFSVPKDFFR